MLQAQRARAGAQGAQEQVAAMLFVLLGERLGLAVLR